MKTRLQIIFIVTAACLGACSNQDDASARSDQAERLVPESAKAITSSSEWTLDFTSKTGIGCYVKTVSDDVRKRLYNDFEHPDYEYLQHPSVESEPAYFLVLIRNGKIVTDLNLDESVEITGYILSRDKGVTDTLREAIQ